MIFYSMWIEHFKPAVSCYEFKTAVLVLDEEQGKITRRRTRSTPGTDFFEATKYKARTAVLNWAYSSAG
jgi:hypothetical protein